MNRRTVTVACLGLMALAFVTYLPSLRGGFLWDDDDHLTHNPAVAAPDGPRQIWLSLAVSRYYPLTLTTFWAERQLWGLHPLPFRLVNVAIHALNATLLGLLLGRLRIRGGWVAAALWLVHPVNVESVAWITELKNTQSFLFLLLCLHAYLSWDETRRGYWYALALLACAAAFTSKPSTVTLPAMLLLVSWWQHRRRDWRALGPVLPFFLMAAGMSWLTIAEQHRHVVGAGTAAWRLGLAARVLVASRALWFYAGKLLAPVPLMFVYPRWEIRADSILAWLPLVAIVLGGALAWRRPAVWLGPSLFVLALLPVLGLFDIYYFRFSYVADHFNYLGSAVFLAWVVAIAAHWWGTRPWRDAVAGTLIVVLGALSWQHARAFQSDERLWTDTLAKNPAAFLAHANLATIRCDQGRIADAKAHWQEALRLDPTCWEAWMGLGKLYRDTGRDAEAINCFTQALRLRPGFVDARYGLGMIASRRGQWTEARAQFEAALAQQPHDSKALLWLGAIATQQGRTNEAIAHYVGAIENDPTLADAYLSLGRIRRQRGETERAIKCFQAVLRLRPGDADARAALAALTLPAGQP